MPVNSATYANLDAIINILRSSLVVSATAPRHTAIWIYRHMDADEFEKIVVVLSKTIYESRRLLKKFKVAPRTKRFKLFALIVLNELVRKSESVEAMAKAKAYSGINAVTRASFESYADLLNLLKHQEDYADYMVYMSFNQQRTLLQPVTANADSKFAKSFEVGAKESLGTSPDEMLAATREQMDDIQQALPDVYKDRKGKVITQDKFKFKLSDQLDEYDALYRHLSSSSHGRVSAMVEGIMHGDAIQWPPSEPVTRPLVAIDCLCAILLAASGLMAKKYGKPKAPIKEIVKEHAAIRGEKSGLIAT